MNNNIDKYVNDKLDDILQKEKEYKKTNLVLSGGGMGGIVQLGALKALKDNGFLDHITSISATSVGSLIATMYVIGYTIDELYEFLELLDISKMKSINPSKFLTHFGLDDGKKISIVIEKLFEAKSISPHISFAELYKKTGIKLYITGSCLNDKQIYYLSHLTFPNMPLSIAVRISTSVPFWFVPVEYDGKLYVDGGCMENYPALIFKDDLDSTIGLHLCTNHEYVKKIDNLESYLINLMQCFEEASVIKATYGYEKCTIKLNTCGISPYDLNMDVNTKKEMFDFGYNEVLKSQIVISHKSIETLNIIF
jgi:NTE family protein